MCDILALHHNDVIMSAMAFKIPSLAIVYSTVYSGVDQRKHQSSASLAFVRGIHRSPVNSPHNGPVTRKMIGLRLWRICQGYDRQLPVTDMSHHFIKDYKTNVPFWCYSGSTRFTTWLRMSWWFLSSPGHQRPWHWPHKIGKFLQLLKNES